MERFYHIRAQQHGYGAVLNNGGATVHLESIAGDPLHLRMRVAYCNPKDVFNKKIGRTLCIGAPGGEGLRRNPETGEAIAVLIPAVEPKEAKVVALRSLPSELGQVYRNVHHRMRIKRNNAFPTPNYEHRLREWLPKE